MTQWWQDLSARERMLVAVAGALAALLLVSLGVVRPLADWRADAERKARSARDAYQLTAAAAAVSGDGGAQESAGARTPLREAVLASANAAGVELIRIGSEQNGQIEIQAAQAPGDTLFGWFAVLEGRYGVTVAFADMTRAEAGRVNAQLLVFERRS
jgi:general secretion pathway protein M